MARRAASFVSCLLAAPILICGSACAAPSPAGTETARSATGGVNHPAARDRPYVVLVSFDGFRADYLDRFDTPNFDALAVRGAIAEGLVTVFPSMTFPGHYTIATGMHPEAHGIVGNRFHDPVRGETFDYRDREKVEDGSWWGGEPIWVTAETQGLVAAAMFFPGAEAAVGGVRPTHWRRYDRGLSNLARVETVIEWLTLPPANRPHLVTLYFSLVAGAVPTSRAADLDEAVAQALAAARDGDVVLLSPACASFDMFDGFAARGDAFVAAVERLGGRP